MKTKPFIALVVILLITAIAFSPSLVNNFTNWDDPEYILENQNLLMHPLQNIANLFTGFVKGNYHPITMLTFNIECFFFGLNPITFHLTNFLLHLLNTLLLYLFINKLTQNIFVSFITSLLWGIHPLQVESVAWVSERKNVLYCFFYLCGLYAYLFSGKKRLILTIVFFILSLLSKAVAVTFPVILLLIDFFQNKLINKKLLIEKIPFFLLSLIFGILAVWAQREGFGIDETTDHSVLHRFLIGSYGFLIYLIKIIIPYNLSCYYPYPEIINNQLPTIFYFSPIVWILYLGMVWYFFNRNKLIFFGLFFFLVNLFLLLQFFPIGHAIIAERYTYLASAGLFLFIGLGLYELIKNKMTKYSMWIFITAYSIFLSYNTFSRCEIWNNSLTLWNDAISKNPNVALPFNNRGYYFSEIGEFKKALNDFDSAILIDSKYINAYNNRGVAYLAIGNPYRAIEDFNKAVILNPKYIIAYINKGEAYNKLLKFNEAIECYTIGLNIFNYNPKLQAKRYDYEIYNVRGSTYINAGYFQNAIDDYTKSIEINDKNGKVFFYRSNAYYYNGNYDKALYNALIASELGYNVSSDYIIKLKELLNVNHE